MRRASSLIAPTRPARPAPARPAPPADYLQMYALAKPPFGAQADSTFILFASQRRTFELLSAHAINGHGAILLLGEAGSGKTEMLNGLALAVTRAGGRVIPVSRPAAGRITLPRLIAAIRGQPGDHTVPVEEALRSFLAPPRKTLLVDDVETLDEECAGLLAALADAIATQPDGAAIVATCTAMPPSDAARPELSKFAGTASNVVHLPALSATDARDYVERRLWIAGSTTRRLIDPNALKLLIARSGGNPGTIDRFMEAALTASFARAEPLIGVKTMSAVVGVGRATPRPRSRQTPVFETGGTFSWFAPAAGILLLAAGIGAFGYEALYPPPPSKPAPVADMPPAPATPPAPALDVEESGSASLPPDVMATLLRRGEQSLALGDIAAARLLFQRAAEAGNAGAATAVGKTYDPKFVPSGQTADAKMAQYWYRRAQALGDPDAVALLDRLGTQQ